MRSENMFRRDRASWTKTGFQLWPRRLKRNSSCSPTSKSCAAYASVSGVSQRQYSGIYQETTLYNSWRFLTILLELLGKQRSVKEVFFQEPEFNNGDLALLRSYGYTVVKTPFAVINSNTFVFAPCLDYNINARIFENGYPALYIGNLFEEMISKMRYEEFSGRDRSHDLLDEVMDRWIDATLAERMLILKEGEGVCYFEIRWQRGIGKESTLSEEDRHLNGKSIRISRYETLLRTLLRQRSCESGFKTG